MLCWRSNFGLRRPIKPSLTFVHINFVIPSWQTIPNLEPRPINFPISWRNIYESNSKCADMVWLSYWLRHADIITLTQADQIMLTHADSATLAVIIVLSGNTLTWYGYINDVIDYVMMTQQSWLSNPNPNQSEKTPLVRNSLTWYGYESHVITYVMMIQQCWLSNPNPTIVLP